MSRSIVSRVHSSREFRAGAPPVLEVDPGTEVTFETEDQAYRRLYEGAPLSSFQPGEFNMITGPVAVRGAEPGDALRLDILEVVIERAWAVWMPGFGPLGGGADRLQVSRLEIEGDRIRIGRDLTVPLDPMIGCIGVAPREGTASTLEPAYPFGGNMDLREVSPGATLFLPVQVPGALLSVGDLHAAMGAGEPTSLSIESSGRATVRVGLEKGMRLAMPRLRVPGGTLLLSVLDAQGTLEQAYVLAIQQAYKFLVEEWGLAPFDAYTYCCARVAVRFGGPASAMVLAVVPDPR